jgi:hypothetical protein
LFLAGILNSSTVDSFAKKWELGRSIKILPKELKKKQGSN